jgi:hypothetical protein
VRVLQQPRVLPQARGASLLRVTRLLDGGVHGKACSPS